MADETLNLGVGDPSNAASAGQSGEQLALSNELSSIANTLGDTTSEQNTVVPPTGTPTDQPDETAELINEAPDDTPLVKKLRGLLRDRTTRQATVSDPVLDETQTSNLALVNSLFEFDMATGKPTTVNFAKKLAESNVLVASDVFSNLSGIPLKNDQYSNWTVAHEWLKTVVGIDPTRIEEFRAISEGRSQSPIPATVPEYIPREYAEAYKSLSPVVQADLDMYLSGDQPDRKAAAMQLLQDRNSTIQTQRMAEASEQETKVKLEKQVNSQVEAELTTAYNGIIDSIKDGEVFKTVKVNSNDTVDSALKESVLSQIIALGDANPVLSSRAKSNLTSLGVQVNSDKIQSILNSIEQSTSVIERAKLMQSNGQGDFSMHISQANSLRNSAISQAVGLANSYFQAALKAVSGSTIAPSDPTLPVPPIIQGGAPASKSAGDGKVLTPDELDKLILGTASSMGAGR